MSLLEIYLVTFAVVIGFMTIVWLISIPLKDVSIVDLVWGMGFVVAAVTQFILTPEGYRTRQILLTGMVALWGLRLSIYLTWRKFVQHKGEDYRYKRIRERIGPSMWWRSWIIVFLLQGAIVSALSGVFLAVNINAQPAALTVFDLAGVALWGFGFFFESVGDFQLARFKSDPNNKGKVMDKGLWGLTRHPNYFGDACVWWGFYLLALSVPFGFLTIYGPIIMNFLLVRVSGVALLEKDLSKKRPEYAEYIRSVPAFIPRFPGRGRRS